MKQMGSRIKELFYLAQFGTLFNLADERPASAITVVLRVISAASLLDCKVN